MQIAPFSRTDSAFFLTENHDTSDLHHLIELTGLDTTPTVSYAANLQTIDASEVSFFSKEPVHATSTQEMSYMFGW